MDSSVTQWMNISMRTNHRRWARDVTRQVRGGIALPEDLSLVPNTHTTQLTPFSNSGSGESVTSGLPGHQHSCAYGNPTTHNLKPPYNFKNEILCVLIKRTVLINYLFLSCFFFFVLGIEERAKNVPSWLMPSLLDLRLFLPSALPIQNLDKIEGSEPALGGRHPRFMKPWHSMKRLPHSLNEHLCCVRWAARQDRQTDRIQFILFKPAETLQVTVCSGCSEGQGGQQNLLGGDQRGLCKGILGRRGHVAKTQRCGNTEVLSVGNPCTHRHQGLHIQDIQEEDLICKWMWNECMQSLFS